MTEEEPKIIVDDDWKQQAQREKEELQKQAESADENEQADQLPPASFPVLVTTLGTQAMSALGLFPDINGQTSVNLPMAKHFIDTLGVLEEKTQGNLSKDEADMVTESLHQLRMAYVQVANSPAAESQAEPPKSSIELP